MRDEDVAGREVAVNDAQAAQVRDGFQDAAQDRQRLMLGQSVRRAPDDQRAEALALEELHRDEGELFVTVEVVHRDDVGMVELFEKVDLFDTDSEEEEE